MSHWRRRAGSAHAEKLALLKIQHLEGDAGAEKLAAGPS